MYCLSLLRGRAIFVSPDVKAASLRTWNTGDINRVPLRSEISSFINGGASQLETEITERGIYELGIGGEVVGDNRARTIIEDISTRIVVNDIILDDSTSANDVYARSGTSVNGVVVYLAIGTRSHDYNTVSIASIN